MITKMSYADQDVPEATLQDCTDPGLKSTTAHVNLHCGFKIYLQGGPLYFPLDFDHRDAFTILLHLELMSNTPA